MKDYKIIKIVGAIAAFFGGIIFLVLGSNENSIYLFPGFVSILLSIFLIFKIIKN